MGRIFSHCLVPLQKIPRVCRRVKDKTRAPSAGSASPVMQKKNPQQQAHAPWKGSPNDVALSARAVRQPDSREGGMTSWTNLPTHTHTPSLTHTHTSLEISEQAVPLVKSLISTELCRGSHTKKPVISQAALLMIRAYERLFFSFFSLSTAPFKIKSAKEGEKKGASIPQQSTSFRIAFTKKYKMWFVPGVFFCVLSPAMKDLPCYLQQSHV